jgi:hypothetical protein
LLKEIQEALFKASTSSVEAEMIIKQGGDLAVYQSVRELQRATVELARAEALSWCVDREEIKIVVRRYADAMRALLKMESGDSKAESADDVNELFGQVTIAIGRCMQENL